MTLPRRVWMLQSLAGLAAWGTCRAAHAADGPARIEKQVLLHGRDGKHPTWFHPRCCVVPGPSGPTILMTLQTIHGSDYFGPVHWMTTVDHGRTWTSPEPVPSLGRMKQPSGVEEGVCDVVPEWHAPTRSVLALGHNVWYSGPKFSSKQPPRWPVYSVWKDQTWGPRRRLNWDDPRGAQIYTNNCGQRVVLPGGDILLAFTYGERPDVPRAVSSIRCRFDGTELSVQDVGREITHPHGRGLLEPSLIAFQQRFFLTLRAEDQRGYVCASDDGMTWSARHPWSWDNGEPLALSTTQQHWLAQGDTLWLVYTRRDPTNINVIRWRSPLWMAQVDPATLRLRRDTERVVLPLVGDGIQRPDEVALMGNFHPLVVNEHEAWVTVGEWQPRNGIKGDLLLARIHWR